MRYPSFINELLESFWQKLFIEICPSNKDSCLSLQYKAELLSAVSQLQKGYLEKQKLQISQFQLQTTSALSVIKEQLLVYKLEVTIVKKTQV